MTEEPLDFKPANIHIPSKAPSKPVAASGANTASGSSLAPKSSQGEIRGTVDDPALQGLALPASDIVRMAQRYKAGWLIRELARHDSVTEPTVRKYLKLCGIALTGRKVVSDADAAAIAARYAAGETPTSLSNAFGYSTQTVINCVRRNGGEVKPRGRSKSNQQNQP